MSIGCRADAGGMPSGTAYRTAAPTRAAWRGQGSAVGAPIGVIVTGAPRAVVEALGGVLTDAAVGVAGAGAPPVCAVAAAATPIASAAQRASVVATRKSAALIDRDDATWCGDAATGPLR